MLIFKSGLFIFPPTFLLCVILQATNETNSLVTGLAFLLLASGLVAGKILYDRYQQIHILGSLTSNPSVTCFANKLATFSAILLTVGFLISFLLFVFQADSQCITAVNIYNCCCGSLYMWVQCILSTYISTMFYDKYLLQFRQCLSNVSFPFLIATAMFGSLAAFLPKDLSTNLEFCHTVNAVCMNILTVIFLTYIYSFKKDYEFFSEGLRSELLLDDGCSFENNSLADVNSIFGTQEISNAMVIKGNVTFGVIS